jgi:N-ethylmaleimide reductase
LAKVTKRVHDKDGKFIVMARRSYVILIFTTDLPLSASALNAKSFTPEGFKDTVTAKAMTIDQNHCSGFKNAAQML